MYLVVSQLGSVELFVLLRKSTTQRTPAVLLPDLG